MVRHYRSIVVTMSLAVSVALMISDLAYAQNPASNLLYPKSKVVDQIDDYHGTKINDPFRWLEDVDSEDTKSWVVEQNKLTFDYLESIPARARFKRRLTELWNFERYGLPRQYGKTYFYTYNNGLQNQNVLYTASSIDDAGLTAQKLLLDPNLLSQDGTVALSGYVPSDDGKYLAYGVAESGSDWNVWRVRDVATGQDLSDTIRWVKFSSVAWTSDHLGFFYSRYDEPKENEFTGVNYFQKLYYHRIGTDQSQDVLVYERPDQKEWGFGASVSDDGKYLAISVWRGTEKKSLFFYAPIADGTIPSKQQVVELVSDFNADWQFLGNDGKRFYFETDDSAPKHRIVAIDLDTPESKDWKTLVPETQHSIESSSLLGDRFLVHYIQDATSTVREFSIDGKPGPELNIPSLGTVSGFEGKRSAKETFFSFTNYITPLTVVRLDLDSLESTTWKSPKVAFDPANYLTERVFYISKDGTRIPMILSRKKGIDKNGQMPTILYGYGGFNISITPNFSPANVAWMEQGGMYAVANLRGGGEYGRDWHESGMLENKQRVFDDFIGAAEHLIQENYTSSSKLAISGRSNGGLLVGATMTQRPDLFAVALPAVGVMDMLRFHKFTIGWAWVSEFGSSENPEQFQNLLRYSPLHRLKPGTRYPATLITTGDHDDRVVPGHSYKFAARLQSCQSGTRPTLIRIETSAGHGAGTPVAKLIDTAADTLGFVWKNFGLE
ncbi:MAG: prolyl oligopeptidase family serine peptidase [Planctomycetota bacterium]|jgi:prolyl oligopeptidase